MPDRPTKSDHCGYEGIAATGAGPCTRETGTMEPNRMIAALLGLGLVAGAFAQDQCKPIGWATRTGRTGGAYTVTGGGNATPIVVTTFADLQKYVQDNQPRVIHVSGTLGSGWSGTTGDRLSISASNKTIIGMTARTVLKAPIRIYNNAQNIIVRNLVINGPGSNEDQAWDNINIDGGARNIWIDHCEFWDGQDGNADVIKGSDNVTFTWNIFGYKKNGAHNLSNLIASSDDEPVSVGKLNITFMNNWWTGAAQRQPRCRYGNIHVVNNLFTRDGMQSDYGLAAGKDCQILAENNHFYQINTPINTDLKAGTAGTVSKGNLFEGTTGNQAGFGTAFTPPYEYASMMVSANAVKAQVQKLAGATLTSPTACAPPPVGISEAAKAGGPSFGWQGNVLVAEGFGSTEVEFLVGDISGKMLVRRMVSVADGSARMELPSQLAGAGVLLVSTTVPGRSSLTAKIHTLR